MTPKRIASPIVLAVWSVWMIWAFGYYTLGGRLWTQLTGVVTESRDVPATRGPRYITEYTIRELDGKEITYTAGPTDRSLPRSMPVGTSLVKDRWQLGYVRDGRWVNDFGIAFYFIVLSIGFTCLAWSFFLWRRQS